MQHESLQPSVMHPSPFSIPTSFTASDTKIRDVSGRNAKKRRNVKGHGPRPGREGLTPHQAQVETQETVATANAILAAQPRYVQDTIRDIRQQFFLELDSPASGDDEVLGLFQDSDFAADQNDEEGPQEDPSIDPISEMRAQMRLLMTEESIKGQRDDRSYAQQLKAQFESWKTIGPTCANAYLEWKHGRRASMPNPNRSNLPTIDVFDEDLQSMQAEVINVDTISLFGYHKARPIWQLSKYRNVSLIRQGFLGTSPLVPQLAICLDSLSIYVTARSFCPTFSVERFARTLCERAKVRYTSAFRRQLSAAVDCFMEMDRYIDTRLNEAIGEFTLEDRLLSACPACHHKIPDEPALVPAMIMAMDGNESQRRSASNMSDLRQLESRLYLSEEYVNQFQGAGSKSKRKKSVHDQDAEMEATGSLSRADRNDQCTKNWAAAKPDEQKRMWDRYDETGIFVLTCRHGAVLMMVDMIRSGELAKYPLALVSKALEVYGNDLAIAYDIGCSFDRTVINSSLGEAAKKQRLQLVTPVWHGYSHNRLCQLGYHMLYRTGMGLEDGEGCERVFSWTNTCARSIRQATKFHRKQVIDQTVRRWNTDKLRNLGDFVYKNYRQAVKILEENERDLQALETLTCVNRNQFSDFLQEELEYIVSVPVEPPQETLEMTYMELRLKLAEARRLYDFAKEKAEKAKDSQKKSLYQRYWNTSNDILLKMTRHVRQFEAINDWEPWEEGSTKWQESLHALQTRNYRRALDKLSGLLIQRLMELEKMGLSETAYKLRKSLAKALKRRSVALAMALKKFNIEAKKLDRPTLNFEDLLSYTFIADFELLRESREDIRQRAWAAPAVRKALVLWLKIERAKEEIIRLQVEARRIRHWVTMHSSLYQNAAAGCASRYLAAELQERAELQVVHNSNIIRMLDHMDRLALLGGEHPTGDGRHDRHLDPAVHGLLVLKSSRTQAETTQPTDGDNAEVEDEGDGDELEGYEAQLESLESFVEQSDA